MEFGHSFFSILGVNPHLSVIEGFFRRIWKDLGIVKVASIDHGVYIVRFCSMQNRDKVSVDHMPT